MQFVKVQYDAYNRQFTFMDHQGSSQMEDGSIYLIAGLSPTDYLPADDLDLIEANHTPA
ncbi:MAG TPA: hypothetical protein VLL56_10800 [Terriglobia bacterium]|jgi:hypothetical protein|nr:hypothetical protein [Terriglobia bacterium]